MQRMMEENEEAMTNALKADLRRSLFGAKVFELWDVVGQVFVQSYDKNNYLCTSPAVLPLYLTTPKTKNYQTHH